jgi:hypothetical protein
MRVKSLVKVGLVAALAVACMKQAGNAGGPASLGSSAGAISADSACSGAAASTPAPAGSVTLKFSVDPVGSRWTETETQRLALDIVAGAQKVAVVDEDTMTKQTEVLAASPVTVTKAKITFVDVVAKRTTGGTTKEMPSPHAGKAYVLEADPSGAVTVMTADGAPVSAEEAAAVKKGSGNFGKPPKIGRALDGMTFELGKRVEVPAERAQGAFGEDGKVTVELLALTLTKLEGNDAWFDLEMVGSDAAAKDSTMKITLKGPLHIDLTISKPLEMSLEGTVEVTGATSATGTMTMSGKRTKS